MAGSVKEPKAANYRAMGVWCVQRRHDLRRAAHSANAAAITASATVDGSGTAVMKPCDGPVAALE